MRRWLGVVFAILVLLAPSIAGAAMMRHYDLTSLAFMSDAVVRATKVSERKVGAYTTLVTYRVVESYAGDLAAGAEVEVDASLYAMEQPFTDKKRAVGPEVFVFLHRVRPEDRRDDEPTWWITSSGLRVVLDGKVQRFEQWSNPGGFAPVPQRRDPWDLRGDPRAGPPLTPAEMDGELRRAVERSARVKKVIDAPASQERTASLLELLGPPPEKVSEDRPVTVPSFGFASDEVARALIEAIAGTKDRPATLDALARAPTVDTFLLRLDFGVDALLDAARDAKLPPSRRVAALRLLSRGVSILDLRGSKRAPVDVRALYADPSPDVRAAALGVSFEEKASEATKAALVARFGAEKDPTLRIGVFEALRSADALESLALAEVPLPLVAAERRGRAVDVRWTDRYVDREPWHMVRLEVRARRQDGASAVQRFDPAHLVSHFSSVSGSTAFLAFDQPLRAGTWTLDADVELARDKKPNVTRTLSLGVVVADAEGLFGPIASPADPLAEADAGVAPVSDVQDAAAGDAGPAPATPRRACGCSVPGSPADGGGVLFALVAALTAAGARGSRRAR